MMRKIPLLVGIFILGGLLIALPVSGVDAEAAENDMSVTIQTEILLSPDWSDLKNPVFKGTGSVYATTQDAYSHKIVGVSLPDEFIMGTPVGEKSAPVGTRAVFKGSMNARNGFENYRAVNGIDGKTASDIYMGQIEVSVPLTKDFLDYGAGNYSMSVPVTLVEDKAYGSYSKNLDLTSWNELMADSQITVSDGKLTGLKKDGVILDIDPSITAIEAGLNGLSYTEVDIPASVVTTNGRAPLASSKVSKVMFGEGMTEVPEFICFAAMKLENVVLPDTVNSFGMNCFNSCISLTFEGINMPSEYTLKSGSFANCSSIKELHIHDGVKTDVTMYEVGPFYHSGIERVIVDDGATEVPYKICAECNKVNYIYLPESLRTIRTDCFTEMSELKDITVRSELVRPDSELGSQRGCFINTGLRHIKFEDGITEIPESLFKDGCSEVTDIELPESIESIGEFAFAECYSLKQLELPMSLETIGQGCFHKAYALSELQIRKDYKIMGEGTISPFEGSGISRLIIEEGVTSIDSNMFFDACNNVTELILPSTLREIGSWGFGAGQDSATSIKSVTIKSNLTMTGGELESAFGYYPMETIIYAPGVTEINRRIFKKNNSLKDVYIPSTVNKIEYRPLDSDNSYTVHFDGTEAEWETINFNQEYFEKCIPSENVICSDTAAGAKNHEIGETGEVIPDE